MVGYLPGTDATFANPANQVSAHFGIGYRTDGGPVRISQYVDLSDTAWTAGNYDPSGGWTLVKKTPSGVVINPNYYIVGIEHEDGGPNDGRVSDEVKVASLWLQSILVSGDIDLIKFVGIKIKNQSTADALKIIPLNTETIIDHNRIAGNKKPYCWRPYKLDTEGFPVWQPILIEGLKGSKMAIHDTLDLLEQQILALEAERDAALIEASTAQAKLSTAKVRALEIQEDAHSILDSAEAILNL